ncbi:MAG: iron-sulfur cluster assembly accessory protein [Pseudomonadota bacterium]
MTTTTDAAAFSVTDAAAKRIAEIMTSEPEPAMLRLSVEGGGCTGFQYKFDLVPQTAQQDDDVVIDKAGALVVIDSVSLPFIAGSELDYVDALIGASFKVNNPNAVAACGCGTSFSI